MNQQQQQMIKNIPKFVFMTLHWKVFPIWIILLRWKWLCWYIASTLFIEGALLITEISSLPRLLELIWFEIDSPGFILEFALSGHIGSWSFSVDGADVDKHRSPAVINTNGPWKHQDFIFREMAALSQGKQLAKINKSCYNSKH